MEIPEGYTRWDGGENPVPGEHVAIIMIGVPENMNGNAGLSDRLRWEHEDGNRTGDIVAYKII